ncbi:hypothetical protein Hanom_Chr16g01488611 [Helianthus anomalus]
MQTHKKRPVIMLRVEYMVILVVYKKSEFWSLAFQKYTDGPCGLYFITHLVPSQQI